jgi:rubrerythrin
MDADLTIVEVLGLAIRSEEEAAKFYGGLARRVGNELVRAKFEALAREEGLHRRMLVALHAKTTGEDAPPPRIPGTPATAEGTEDLAATDSLEELLLLAIRREREAAIFYRRAAERVGDPTGRNTLYYLADIERGHEVVLAAELEAYRRDASWYEGVPDLQLV